MDHTHRSPNPEGLILFQKNNGGAMLNLMRNPLGDRETLLFENSKELLSPQEVSRLLEISKKTIYDWKYRPILRRVPEGLFVKFNRKIFIRTDILRNWILSQNR